MSPFHVDSKKGEFNCVSTRYVFYAFYLFSLISLRWHTISIVYGITADLSSCRIVIWTRTPLLWSMYKLFLETYSRAFSRLTPDSSINMYHCWRCTMYISHFALALTQCPILLSNPFCQQKQFVAIFGWPAMLKYVEIIAGNWARSGAESLLAHGLTNLNRKVSYYFVLFLPVLYRIIYSD